MKPRGLISTPYLWSFHLIRFTLTALAVGLEILTFILWGSPFFAVGPARWSGALTHLLGCLLLYLAWVGSWKQAPSDAKTFFQLLMAVFFPGVGWLLALLMRLQPALTTEEVRMLQSLREEPEELTLPMPRQAVPLAWNVQPLTDTLASDEMDLKREAIRRLANRQNPSSIALLKKALADPRGDIRLYAVNALTQVEGRLVETIQKAEQTTVDLPERLNSWMTLGMACRRYAESGLLEGVMKKIYFRKALRALEKGRALFPESPAAWTELLHTYTHLGEAEAVARLLERAVERFPNDFHLRLFQARFAFASGWMAETRRAIASLPREELELSGLPQEVIELWLI